MPRRFPIFQFPNRPLIAAVVAAAVAGLSEGALAGRARVLSRLALLVWAGEEITMGANWFRRLLGVMGAGFALRGLSAQESVRKREAPGTTGGSEAGTGTADVGAGRQTA